MTNPKIDVFDNEGKTFDRYTVIIEIGKENAVFGMSLDPQSLQGFNQYCCDLNQLVKSKEMGKLVQFALLPKAVQEAIKERVNQFGEF